MGSEMCIRDRKIKNQVDKLCYEEEQMDIKKYETEKEKNKKVEEKINGQN